MKTIPKIKKAKVIQALHSAGGFVSQAAKMLKITPKTLYNYINKDNDIKEELELIREGTLDFTEAKLLENIKNGDITAIIFKLKCHGKNRGYIDKQVIDNNIKTETITINWI